MGLYPDIGIDLGTANTRIYVRGKGILLREPSVVALDRRDGRLFAAGRQAQMMVGKAPGKVTLMYPMKDGVIADYRAAMLMIHQFIGMVMRGRGFVRPRALVAIPPRITAIERKAVIDAVNEAGASGVELIDVPLAVAMGLGLDPAAPKGHMVVSLGGGVTSVAVLSLGDIVATECIRTGGKGCDEAIVKYVKEEHRLAVTEHVAESLKIRLGYAHPSVNVRNETAEVSGRDIVSGMPRTVTLTAEEIFLAISPLIGGIVDGIKWTLEKTSPELAADIGDQGLFLTGGGANLPGLDRLLFEKICLPVHIAEDPLDSVVTGLGKFLEDLETVKPRWTFERLFRRTTPKVTSPRFTGG